MSLEASNEMTNFSGQFVSRTALTLTLVVVVCLCAPAQTANSQQSPVPAADGKGAQSVKVSAVVLDEKNNFVNDLRAEDFVLTENGVPQPVTSFTREDLPTLDFNHSEQLPQTSRPVKIGDAPRPDSRRR